MTPIVGVAHRNADGEVVCGDASLVLQSSASTLVLIADGLGHGHEAATAAQRFCQHVRDHAEDDLESLLRGAHTGLMGTRGVAAGVAHIDHATRTLRFAGVGNIEVAALSRESIAPVCSPGVIGGRLKRISVFTYDLHQGDLIVMVSDGITRPPELEPYRRREPGRIAEQILAKFGLGRDDATCVVVRA